MIPKCAPASFASGAAGRVSWWRRSKMQWLILAAGKKLALLAE